MTAVPMLNLNRVAACYVCTAEQWTEFNRNRNEADAPNTSRDRREKRGPGYMFPVERTLLFADD